MQNFQPGGYVKQGYYKAFIPSAVNREWTINDMRIVNLLSRADRLLGKLDMYSNYVDIELYIRMHIVKEATQSSRIEGTQTSIEDAFVAKEDIDPQKREDWDEVQNYIAAMNESVLSLERLPFSSRLIKKTHKTLLQGVRGKHKSPGEYRVSQNWIGGATINDARFVPPPHAEIGSLMSDLEKFANNDSLNLPNLLKIALIHYQFETIHPFLDGNGRVGRLMITLYLIDKGDLKRPILYLSDFFEKHRDLYYDNLMSVRTRGDIAQWFSFFLTGVIETAEKGIKTFDDILRLKNEIDELFKNFGKRMSDAKKVTDTLYSQPIVDANAITQIIGKSRVTAHKLLNDLVKLGVINQLNAGGKRKYYFAKYLALF
ncbi:MAG: Fic family protein [Helicobacteraceae bacterium]|jgi:Fic family protein|nr:Fic family protein [Helicobacteraceae bacterium]